MDERNRAHAETEAARDLRKPMVQLLADVHTELEAARTVEANLIHGQKRLASLLARAAVSAERSSKLLLRLTWAIVALTIVLVLLTAVMIGG